MASNSGRKSGSSGRSSSRNRVVIGAEETTRVRYAQDRPQVESQRNKKPRTSTAAPKAKPTKEPRAGARKAPRPVSAGRKVASQKRDQRDQRRREIARRRALIGIGVVAAVGLLVWGLIALWQAPLFTVDTVSVTGNSRLSKDEVLKLAAVPAGATLLRLPSKQILAGVQSSPWVAKVVLAREFPNTLNITVTERVPVAMVEAGAAGSWIVSGDGYWLAKHGAEPTGSLLPVRDVPNLAPKVGAKVSSAELNNALAVVQGISQQLRAEAKFVSAASIEKTMIVLKNGVQVFVGPADDIKNKDLIARGILSSKKGVVYVNVRVTDRPTWRGLAPAN
jgi:cell division protein FtsQ